MWIRNCWYVVAWNHEIPSADAPTLFRRVVLGEPLLIYRIGSNSSDSNIVVLEDRCCHRHAPLSAGRREGDAVRCGYHGLLFNRDGACVQVPGLSKVPPKVCVRRYPAVVHNKWVMVWMGDAQRADPALLPDNFSCDDPGWRYLPGYLHYETPWELIADNLLDFSHLSYVHAATLGGTDQIAHVRPTVQALELGVRVARRVPGVPPPAYYRALWDYTGLIDRWIDYSFTLPATLLMHSGARPAGAAQDDERVGVRFHSCQALTPETAESTHYFFQESHRAEHGGPDNTQRIFDGLLAAFLEDRQMIGAQWHNMALPTDRPMLPLAMDAALMMFRRKLQTAVDAEASAAVAASTP